tara:strand:+ start:2300 stop:2500 length:201 start_codon:yes stop_codon:yes gene_type:complete
MKTKSAHACDAAFFDNVIGGNEVDFGAVDQLLAAMFEIHRYSVTDHGLYLSDAPIGLVGQQHETSR